MKKLNENDYEIFTSDNLDEFKKATEKYLKTMVDLKLN